MRNKGVIIAAGCLAAVFLAGLFGVNFVSDAEVSTEQKDRLIGVYITTEFVDLFDAGAFFQDNISKIQKDAELSREETEKYQGKLYAEKAMREMKDEEGKVQKIAEYDFPIEGSGIFALKEQSENGDYYQTAVSGQIADVRSHYYVTDTGERIELTAKVYCTTSTAVTCYFNPVFQTEDGQIYLTAGSGFQSSGGEAGEEYSQKLAETHSVTWNGETVEETISVEVAMEKIHPTGKIRFLEYDAEGNLLSESAYLAGDFPETLKAKEETAYVVAEHMKKTADGFLVTDREVAGKDEETVIKAYQETKSGLCETIEMRIVW